MDKKIRTRWDLATLQKEGFNPRRLRWDVCPNDGNDKQATTRVVSFFNHCERKLELLIERRKKKLSRLENDRSLSKG